MKRKLLAIVTIIFVLALVIIKPSFKDLYYDFQEYQTLRKSIVWSPKYKLKASDFIYTPQETYMDNFSALIGIVSVHKIRDTISLRTTTVFLPKDSYISDTTDVLTPRIAQARFDLCEVYRRRLMSKIHTINKGSISKITSDSIYTLESLYYDRFVEEWDQFNEIPKSRLMEGLLQMEERIRRELY